MLGRKPLVVTNTISLLLVLVLNYLAASGKLTGVSVAEVSHKYDTLFAPAGYAFSIWGLIYLLSIGFVAYQWYLLKARPSEKFIQQTGLWYAIGNLTNIGWLYCWTNEWLGLSVICILALLISLCFLNHRLCTITFNSSTKERLFTCWPVAIYLGWVMVATIACIASFLVFKSWHGALFGEEKWTILVLIIAASLYILLLFYKQLIGPALVGMWAFTAIAVRQWQSHYAVVITALGAAIILLCLICFILFRKKIA
jgi:hypothetical protein